MTEHAQRADANRIEQHDLRELQIPAVHYGNLTSRVLQLYYKAPDHPSKVRILGWIGDVLGRKRIVVRCKDGFRLAVDRRDYVQGTVFDTGTWEPEVGEYISNNLKDLDVFYDIGANVGYFTCLALKTKQVTIYSFEPDPLTASVLKLNIELNRSVDTRVFVIERGISDCRETRDFGRFGIANIGKSGFDVEEAIASFKVDCCALDGFVYDESHPTPTCIKMDTEGWEKRILKGANKLFETAPPRWVVFEGFCESDGTLTDTELSDFFLGKGYRIRRLKRRTGRIEANENFVAEFE